ncbi:MAG: hypothetical protein ACREOO_12605 [bacterium]
MNKNHQHTVSLLGVLERLEKPIRGCGDEAFYRGDVLERYSWLGEDLFRGNPDAGWVRWHFGAQCRRRQLHSQRPQEIGSCPIAGAS